MLIITFSCNFKSFLIYIRKKYLSEEYSLFMLLQSDKEMEDKIKYGLERLI